jgi:hypothetical protein
MNLVGHYDIERKPGEAFSGLQNKQLILGREAFSGDLHCFFQHLTYLCRNRTS